ncbi:MAG TPA: PilZ domain-containing protein [Polyangia bacterium]|nr:PilZ domain-containing protein [Polyangia bacterium]
MMGASSSATSSSSLPRRRITLQEPADPAELRGTPILSCVFPDGEAFLEAFAPEHGPAGELAVVTRATLPSRTEVVLEILWPALPNRIYVRARVWRRRLGLMARFHPDELQARDFLVRVAHGLPAEFHRRAHRRYCVRLPVTWRAFGATVHTAGIAEDLSAGGVLIATQTAAPPVGERVGVRVIAIAAAQDLVVTGRVMHTRGRAQGAAFGVQFEYRSSSEQRDLRRMLRVFAARGVVILD